MTETLVLRRSRLKSALSVLCAFVCVAIGLFMAMGPISESSRYPPEFVRLVGWVCIAFFGGAGLLGLRNLIRPLEVLLTVDGFQVKGLRRTPMVPWRDIRRFFIAHVYMSKFVCYEIDRAPTDHQRIVGIGRARAWGDGQIPAQLNLHPHRVLELLEDWRHRHGA